jgi:hypothetical protein
MSVFTPDITKRILQLKRVIFKLFSESNWRELGLLSGCTEIIESHSRLFRSLHFGDDDYESCVIDVLEKMARVDIKNIDLIENYVVEVSEGTNGMADGCAVLNRYVCAPGVFSVPSGGIDSKLVALMMPFDAQFYPVSDAIKAAASELGLACKRVDDIWVDSTIIQDVFSLIYHSKIVICDFTGKNANVLYEAGIAHTLGRTVIPLAQHISDIPFDLRHHRHLMYLPNKEGLEDLKNKLTIKLRQEVCNGIAFR